MLRDPNNHKHDNATACDDSEFRMSFIDAGYNCDNPKHWPKEESKMIHHHDGVSFCSPYRFEVPNEQVEYNGSNKSTTCVQGRHWTTQNDEETEIHSYRVPSSPLSSNTNRHPEILWHELDNRAYQILTQAQQEYASPGDRLENFNLRSHLMQASPTAKGMTSRDSIIHDMMKHIISIIKGVSLRESMEGRYIDAMNYLRLLYYYDMQNKKD